MPSVDIRSITAPSQVHAHPHAHRAAALDYSRNPLIVYWEMTQACALACRHCRAQAVAMAHPNQLTHEESKHLLRQIASFDKPLPHLILTGGDPLQRTDVFDLIDYARELGITLSITPSATENLTFDALGKLKAHGIESFGLSLDGSNAARHEAVRGVAGCFDATLRAARDAATLGVPIQINTLVSQETIDDLPAVYDLLKTLKVMRWSLFFLIEVGRGRVLQPISPERGEELMNWVYDLAETASFAIKTTEAPSYRRVALKRMRDQGMVAAQIERTSVYRGFGIRDGHGIVFISNRGDVYPAAFLPLASGISSPVRYPPSIASRLSSVRFTSLELSKGSVAAASMTRSAAAHARAPSQPPATHSPATPSAATNHLLRTKFYAGSPERNRAGFLHEFSRAIQRSIPARVSSSSSTRSAPAITLRILFASE